jgi:hypothetical protein
MPCAVIFVSLLNWFVVDPSLSYETTPEFTVKAVDWHLTPVLDHIESQPYWKRSNGRDHIFLFVQVWRGVLYRCHRIGALNGSRPFT